MADLDYQVALIFKGSYKRYLIGEIGDVELLSRVDLFSWSLALEELAADFRLLANAHEVGAVPA